MPESAKEVMCWDVGHSLLSRFIVFVGAAGAVVNVMNTCALDVLVRHSYTVQVVIDDRPH